MQKRLFGEHYNYSKVGLNKEKKYMIEEQKNTEIERSNRILLEKIQKISKRSVPNGLRKRAFTQEPEEEVQNEERSLFKQTKFFNANRENTENRSHQQLNRTNLADYRTPRGEKKVLHTGSVEAEGRRFELKSFMDKGKFNIEIELGKMTQKIKIELENYKVFYKEYLERDHAKIVNFLKFNGTLFELSNLKRHSVTLEEDSLSLPQLEPQKTEARSRLIDNLDF